MTGEQFVEKYNKTAEACYFRHRIKMGDIPKRILHRKHHRVAGGDSIAFMFTESGGQLRDVAMFDTNPLAEGHRQLHSIAASIMLDVLEGLPKAERKAAIEGLGLPTGQYRDAVPIGKNYVGAARLVDEPPRRTLLVQLQYIRKSKGVTVNAKRTP